MSKPQPNPDIARASVLAADIRALVGKMRRRLREQADSGDLTPSQISVLLRLQREGKATVSALSRTEGMRPQSMGAMIATLQAAGLVSGEPDPNDGRQTLLSLTKTCRQWIGEGRAARHDWLTRNIETRLSHEERVVLARSVELLKRVAVD